MTREERFRLQEAAWERYARALRIVGAMGCSLVATAHRVPGAVDGRDIIALMEEFAADVLETRAQWDEVRRIEIEEVAA